MRRTTALKMSLLAACALHLLVLSAWQLQRSRQRPPQQLLAADDTPLLLQFSREDPTPADPLSITLPSAMPLPPPGPLPSEGTGNLARSASGSSTVRAPSPRPGRQPVAASGSRSSAARRAAAAGSLTPDRATPPSLASGSPLRLALEAVLKEVAASAPAAEGSGGEGVITAAGAGSGAPGRSSGAGQGPSSPETAMTRRLWSLATAASLPEGSDDGLPKGLELRRMPLELARRQGPQPAHGSTLRSDDRLMLLWIQGRTLWLLTVPLPAQAGAAAEARPAETRGGT